MTAIAVISDLHIGAAARCNELNPFAPSGSIADGFLESFQSFAKQNNLTAQMLVIPGDIADRAHPDEYELAQKVIKHVANSLSVPEANVFPLLGNHDLNWALVEAITSDSTKLGHKLRFEPARNCDWLGQRLVSNGRSQLIDPYLCIDETDDCYVVRYNSAEDDVPSKKPHFGRMPTEHVTELDALLKENSFLQTKFKIFVTHHHPLNYTNPIANHPDFSALVNAEMLLRVLHAHRFDFMVHGHKHSPRFTNVISLGARPLPILCAGSFSRAIDTAWSGMITNQFHIIHLEGRLQSTNHAIGEVRSWAYRPNEWIPSDQKWSGINHRHPFGTTISEAEIRTAVSSLKPVLDRRGMIEWADIERMLPEAKYFDPATLRSVLEECSRSWSAIVKFFDDYEHSFIMVSVPS